MTGLDSVDVSRLSPHEIEQRLDRNSLAYLPLGSLEFHGAHLPIGLDGLTAFGICEAAAKRSGGVVLPAIYHAVGGEHTQYPWTFMSRSDLPLRSLLLEILEQLNSLGVERTIVLSGHFAPEQRELIASSAASWNTDHPSMSVIARTLAEVPSSAVEPDHAGVFETLLLAALSPDLVHLNRLPDLGANPLPQDDLPFGVDRHRPAHPIHGVFGPDPREVDMSMAAPLLEHFITWVSGLAESPLDM